MFQGDDFEEIVLPDSEEEYEGKATKSAQKGATFRVGYLLLGNFGNDLHK